MIAKDENMPAEDGEEVRRDDECLKDMEILIPATDTAGSKTGIGGERPIFSCALPGRRIEFVRPVQT